MTLGLWLLGFLIRWVLMPTTFHGDLIHIHHFPYYLSDRGIWDIYGYFGDKFILRAGYTYYQPLVLWIVAFFQVVFRPVNGSFGPFIRHAAELLAVSDPSPAAYYEGMGLTARLWATFFMKLPYLVVDGLCLALIAGLAGTPAERGRLQRAWFFHPVILFSVYMFGQYRIFPVALVWLFLLLLEKNRKAAAFAVWGLLGVMDNFPWILLPVLVLAVGSGWKERIALAAAACGSAAVILLPYAIHSHGYVFYAYVSPLVWRMGNQGITLHHSELTGHIGKALFAVIWVGAAVLALLGRQRAGGRSLQNLPARSVAEIGAVLLFALYATSSTSVHYFMWVLPFWLYLNRGLNRIHGTGVTVLVISLLFLFNLDSRWLNLGLFVPVNPERALAYPSLHEIMSRWVPWGKCVAASRILFSGVCLWMAGRIVRRWFGAGQTPPAAVL